MEDVSVSGRNDGVVRPRAPKNKQTTTKKKKKNIPSERSDAQRRGDDPNGATDRKDRIVGDRVGVGGSYERLARVVDHFDYDIVPATHRMIFGDPMRQVQEGSHT